MSLTITLILAEDAQSFTATTGQSTSSIPVADIAAAMPEPIKREIRRGLCALVADGEAQAEELETAARAQCAQAQSERDRVEKAQVTLAAVPEPAEPDPPALKPGAEAAPIEAQPAP